MIEVDQQYKLISGDWIYEYIIESVNVTDNSFGTILLSCLYYKLGDQSPKYFKRMERTMVVEELWFTATTSVKKVKRIK